MLSSFLALFFSGLFFSLRLGPGSGSFPRPLRAEEEARAVEAWVSRGDIAARNELVEHNLRLVAHIVKKYYAHAADQEDLISIGTIGLIKGVSTYRPDKKVRLATYASRCIENEILMYFRAQRKSAGDLSLSDSIESELRGQVREAVGRVLDAREAEVIRLRYGLDSAAPLTQRETAERCGISRSYISRIEKKALEKLRRAIEG